MTPGTLKTVSSHSTDEPVVVASPFKVVPTRSADQQVRGLKPEKPGAAPPPYIPSRPAPPFMTGPRSP